MTTIPYIEDALKELLKAPQTKEVKMAIHHLNNAKTVVKLTPAQAHNFSQADEESDVHGEATVRDLKPVTDYHQTMLSQHGNEAKELEL